MVLFGASRVRWRKGGQHHVVFHDAPAVCFGLSYLWLGGAGMLQYLSCGAECLCVCARCGRRLLLGGVLWVTPVLIAVQDCTTIEAGGAARWPLLALAMQCGVQVCCTMGMCC